MRLLLLLGVFLAGFQPIVSASDLLVEAREITSQLDDPSSQVINYFEIASAQARAGNREAALELLERVKAISSMMDESDIAVRMTSELAVVYRLLGMNTEARESIERALDSMGGLEDSDRPWVLSWISGCAARAGLFDLAESIMPRIQDPFATAEATGFIAVAKVEKGDLKAALATLEGIDDPNGKGWALADVLESLAAKAPVDVEQLNSIFDSTEKLSAYIDDSYGRATVRLRAARSAHALGQEQRAAQLLNQAREDVELIEEYYWQIESYGLLARLLADLGRKDEAKEVLKKAEAAVARIAVPAARSWNIAEVAVAHARIGAIERAVELGEDLDWLTAQSWVISEIALAEARAGDQSAAEARARSIRVPFWRAKALIDLSRQAAGE